MYSYDSRAGDITSLRYQVLDLSILRPESSHIEAVDLDNWGGIYGNANVVDGSYNPFSFRWLDGNHNSQVETTEITKYPINTLQAGNDEGYAAGAHSPNPDTSYGYVCKEKEIFQCGFVLLDINNQNQAVGYYEQFTSHSTNNHKRGLLCDGKTSVEFPVFGGWIYDIGHPTSFAYGINDLGQVVGMATTDPPVIDVNSPDNLGPHHAFFWTDRNQNKQPEKEEMVDLGSRGGRWGSSRANEINNNGYIVGVSIVEKTPYPILNLLNTRAFLFHDDNGNHQADPGEMKELPLPFSDAKTDVLDINDTNIAVGFAAGQEDQYWENSIAVAWKDDKVINLNDRLWGNLEGILEKAVAVNNDGWILCQGCIGDKRTSFLLKPQSSYTEKWYEYP